MKIEDWTLKWHAVEDALPFALEKDANNCFLVLFKNNKNEELSHISIAEYKNGKFYLGFKSVCNGLSIDVRSELAFPIYWAELPKDIYIFH